MFTRHASVPAYPVQPVSSSKVLRVTLPTVVEVHSGDRGLFLHSRTPSASRRTSRASSSDSAFSAHS